MPGKAKQDLLEWDPSLEVSAYIGLVITNELSIPKILNPDPKVQITDDHPYNEYFLLRRSDLYWR
jgi:hypothetical protein